MIPERHNIGGHQNGVSLLICTLLSLLVHMNNWLNVSA